MNPSSGQPYMAVLGQVVSSLQGVNCYDVIAETGRLQCSYHGGSRGPGGVQESGGILPGTFVWCAAAPGAKIGVILTVQDVSWAVTGDDPKQLSVFPQVSGYELETRLAGEIIETQKSGRQIRPNDSMHDLVDGEWAITSPRGGGGLGVEMFRSWIRGGPMSGLTCFHDTETTRLSGLDFEFLTLTREDNIRRLGNSVVERRTRVSYPAEAIADMAPRELEVIGPIHSGQQRFLAPAGDRGKARMALFHEHLDVDGAYTVTSASGIFLQRFCGTVVPDEAIAPAPADPALLTDPPLDADVDREKMLNGPRPFTSSDGTTGLAWIQSLLDTVEGQTGVRARGGFERLPIQWPDQGQPDGVPVDQFHTTYARQMWRLPTSFTIDIDATAKSKKFYVGRSVIGLMPDGSILIEDANHSQVLMSGGNIVFSAANDLIFTAGRNVLTVAGKNAAIRADGTIDVASNSGAVNIKAETQLALLGGNGGLGGVLVESKALDSEVRAGTGTDQRVGGLLLRSQTGAYLQGQDVGITARDGNVVLDSSTFQVRADVAEVRVPEGFYLYFDDLGVIPAYLFSQTAAIIPTNLLVKGQVDALGSGAFDGQLIASGNIAAGGAVTGSSVAPSKGNVTAGAFQGIRRQAQKTFDSLKTGVQSIAKALKTLRDAKTPLNQQFWTNLGFSFATSKQLGTQTATQWALPEARWQAVARLTGVGQTTSWDERPVASVAGDAVQTSPFPGYETWVTNPTYRLQAAGLYFDVVSGARIPIEDDATGVLLVGTDVPPNKSFVIGT